MSIIIVLRNILRRRFGTLIVHSLREKIRICLLIVELALINPTPNYQNFSYKFVIQCDLNRARLVVKYSPKRAGIFGTVIYNNADIG